MADDHSIQKTDVTNVERLAIMLMTVQDIEVDVAAGDTLGHEAGQGHVEGGVTPEVEAGVVIRREDVTVVATDMLDETAAAETDMSAVLHHDPDQGVQLGMTTRTLRTFPTHCRSSTPLLYMNRAFVHTFMSSLNTLSADKTHLIVFYNKTVKKITKLNKNMCSCGGQIMSMTFNLGYVTLIMYFNLEKKRTCF